MLAEKKRILIVDDEEEIIQFVLRAILNKRSQVYEPVVCVDGYEALEILRKHKVALVLLDIQMRSMDGIEVCERCHQEKALRSVPILVVSGMLQDENKQKLRGLGVKGFLDKPFLMDQLLSKIDALIQEPPTSFYLT